MSIDLEHRLVELGAWLDQAAPHVPIGEFPASGRPDAEVSGEVEEDEVLVPMAPARQSRRARAIGLGVAAAAAVLVLGGLVAVSRRPGTDRPAESPVSTRSESPITTAVSAALDTHWVELVRPLLPDGFTVIATLPGNGPHAIAMDGAGRTISITFGPGGAEQAKQEWAGAGGITLTPGVAGGDASGAAVISAAGDVVAAACWLGDDLCGAASLEPAVDVRPMLEALVRSVTEANRPVIVAPSATTAFDASAANAVSERFERGLGGDFTLSTSGGDVARWSWIRPTNLVERVSLQIVPGEADVDIADVARADLATVTVRRGRLLYTAVVRSTDGTSVRLGRQSLRDLLMSAIDGAPGIR